jgi:hypothetical protein
MFTQDLTQAETISEITEYGLKKFVEIVEYVLFMLYIGWYIIFWWNQFGFLKTDPSKTDTTIAAPSKTDTTIAAPSKTESTIPEIPSNITSVYKQVSKGKVSSDNLYVELNINKSYDFIDQKCSFHEALPIFTEYQKQFSAEELINSVPKTCSIVKGLLHEGIVVGIPTEQHHGWKIDNDMQVIYFRLSHK